MAAATSSCWESYSRWIVLACNCMLTFGTYYCFDMPGVLKSQIEWVIIEPFSAGNGSTLYSLFYQVYAFCNMLMSLAAGVMVDRFGIKVCAFFFLSLCLFGQSLYALGPLLVSMSERSRYIMMFFGRFLFGLGGGPITIVQNAITAKWFKGKELAMAFGFTLTVSRLGSVINFSATSSIFDGLFGALGGEDKLYCAENSTDNVWPGADDADSIAACSQTLGATFFVGAALIVFSYFPACLLFAIDARVTRSRELKGVGADGGEGQEDTLDAGGTKEDVALGARVRSLPASFWTVSVIIALFYSTVFGFLAFAKEFIGVAYEYGDDKAGFAAGLAYLCSMIVSPFLGRAVDYLGRRVWLALYGTAAAAGTFVLFRFVTGADVSGGAYVPMLLLGSAYCVCAAALWPTIQLMVPLKRVGLANGVATSVQMPVRLAVGSTILVAGRLQDNAKSAARERGVSAHNLGYDPVTELYLGLSLAALAASVFLLWLDSKEGGGLQRGQRDLKRAREQEEPLLPSA